MRAGWKVLPLVGLGTALWVAGCDDFEALRQSALCDAGSDQCEAGAGGGAAVGGGSAGGGVAGGGFGGGGMANPLGWLDYSVPLSNLVTAIAGVGDTAVVFQFTGSFTSERFRLFTDGGRSATMPVPGLVSAAYALDDSAVAIGGFGDGGGFIRSYALSTLTEQAWQPLNFAAVTVNIYVESGSGMPYAPVYGQSYQHGGLVAVTYRLPMLDDVQPFYDAGCTASTSLVPFKIRLTPQDDGLLTGGIVGPGTCRVGGNDLGQGGFLARFPPGTQSASLAAIPSSRVVVGRSGNVMGVAWVAPNEVANLSALPSGLDPTNNATSLPSRAGRVFVEVVGLDAGRFFTASHVAGMGKDLAVAVVEPGGVVRETVLPLPGDQEVVGAVLMGNGHVMLGVQCRSIDGGTCGSLSSVLSIDPDRIGR